MLKYIRRQNPHFKISCKKALNQASFVTNSSHHFLESQVSLLVASCGASVSDNSIFFASSSVMLMTASSNAVLNFDAFSALENRIASTSALASSSRI